jgi:hypothetical protein
MGLGAVPLILVRLGRVGLRGIGLGGLRQGEVGLGRVGGGDAPLAGGDGAVWVGLRAALLLGAAGGQQGQGEGQSQKASVGTVFHLKNSFIIKMFCVPESVSKDLTQEREKGSRNFQKVLSLRPVLQNLNYYIRILGKIPP